MIAALLEQLLVRIGAPSRREPWWISLLLGLELASGAALTLWGGFSLLFVDFEHQPAYDVLVRWIDGQVWAAFALAGGLAQVAVAALDFRRLRWSMAFGSCLYWSIISYALLRGSVVPPGAMTQLAWSLVNVPTLLLLRPRWR